MPGAWIYPSASADAWVSRPKRFRPCIPSVCPMTIQSATDEATAAFREAQQRVLDRYQVPAQSRFVDVPSIGGRAKVLVTGEGSPLPMVIGGALPAVFWAPLMAERSGHTLYAIELPGNGRTDRARHHHTTLRRTADAYLADVLDALDIGPGPFVTQPRGSLWTTWLAWEHPGRVRSQVMIACPAFFLDVSAILPWRLVSIPTLGNLLVSLWKPSATGAEQIIRMVGEDPAAARGRGDGCPTARHHAPGAAHLGGAGRVRVTRGWTASCGAHAGRRPARHARWPRSLAAPGRAGRRAHPRVPRHTLITTIHHRRRPK